MSSNISSSELPESWMWSTIEAIAKTQTGGTPSRGIAEYFGGDVLWAKSGELGDGLVDKTEETLTQRGLSESNAKVLPAGTLCIALYGATVGKLGILTKDAATNQAVCGILLPLEMLTKYTFFFLQSIRSDLIAQGKGGAQSNISNGIVRSIRLPIAPLNEQRRIVAKIEELFSELDAGVAALKRVQANLKRYRSAVLKAAVEGRLTEAWRAEHQPSETGSQLLARILKERRNKWEADQLASFAAAGKTPSKGWQAKYKEPAAPDTSDLPSLPKGWCWASVEQLGNVQLGRQRSPKNRSKDHPTKYIRAANLTEDGLSCDDILDMEFTPSERETYVLCHGDLLLSEASGSPDQVGKPAIWKDELEECCFQNTVIRLRPAIASSEYLLTVFQHFYFNKVFAKIAAGVGINHLSAAKFSRIPIPVPPLDEQLQVVAAVGMAMDAVAASGRVLGNAVSRADRLRQSILKQAFEGKLVPQDPTDEPASVLLARIRQQRATPPATTSSPAAKSKKVPKDVFVRRAAIVSYIVNRLATRRSFGRTQLEKTLHLAQSHLGLDLQFAFERYKAGPFDKDIYKIEGVAKKRGWFTKDEPANGKVTYHPGNKIEPMCQSAIRQLADKRAAFDGLLDHIAGMTTNEAELFATAYAAWNDLLIDGRTADDAAIVAEVHGWHEQKKRFTPQSIRTRLQWMRQFGYVPTGRGERTRQVESSSKRRAVRGEGRR